VLFTEEEMLEIGHDMWVWRYGKYTFGFFFGRSDRCQIQFVCFWGDIFKRGGVAICYRLWLH